MRRFFDLAAEQHIPVFWLIPPVPARDRGRQQEMGVTELTDDLAERMQARYPEHRHRRRPGPRV